MFALPAPLSRPLRTCFAVAAFSSLIACGGPSVELNVDLLQVVHASPHLGAVDVDVDVLPVVGLSQAVEGDLSQFHLEAQVGESFEALPVRRVRKDDGHAVMLVPDDVLETGTTYRIRIEEGVESVDGMPLYTEFRSEFTTRR